MEASSSVPLALILGFIKQVFLLGPTNGPNLGTTFRKKLYASFHNLHNHNLEEPLVS